MPPVSLLSPCVTSASLPGARSRELALIKVKLIVYFQSQFLIVEHVDNKIRRQDIRHQNVKSISSFIC